MNLNIFLNYDYAASFFVFTVTTSGFCVRQAGHVTRRIAGVPRQDFIPAETLVMHGTAVDNGTVGGTLNLLVLGFLVG